jgi:hypothetical protein
MDEQKSPEQQRRETNRRAQEAARTVGRVGELSADTIALWADTNQRVMREILELSVRTVSETARLQAAFQQAMFDGFREAQAFALHAQMLWPEALADPVRWYHKSMTEGVESAQRAFKLVDEGAQALTETAGRLQSSAEQAGRGIEQAFSTLTSKLKVA